MRRIGRLSDGWFPQFQPDNAGAERIEQMRQYAKQAGRDKRVAALKRLQSVRAPHDLPGQLAAFGINGGLGQGIRKLFMSHPPLELRIQALLSS